MNILLILAVKLIDPVVIVLGIANGCLSRSVLVLAAVSLGIAVLVELLLATTQVTRTFSPVSLLIGFVVAFAWSGLAFWIRRKRRTA